MPDRSPANPGTTLVDLQGAYADRLAEANDLFGLARYGSSIALALYALEIYLKVRVCMRLDLDELPTAFQIHKLDGLLVFSGFKKRMDSLGTHPVKQHWDSLSSPEMNAQHVGDFRYKPNSTWGREQAAEILRQIQDSNEGVLPWLSAQT